MQIGSHVDDLTDCDPSATLFPAGALFIGAPCRSSRCSCENAVSAAQGAGCARSSGALTADISTGESAGHAESPGPSGWVIPGDAAPGRLLSFMERTNRSNRAVSINDPHWRAVKVLHSHQLCIWPPKD